MPKRKKLTQFRPRLRTKNYSCKALQAKEKNIRCFPVRSVIRFGSTTASNEIFDKGQKYVEVNSVESIQNSRSKLLMKRCFHNFKVPQSYWWTAEETTPGVYAFTPQHEDKKTPNSVEELRYPILAKRVFGFKGKGMEKIDSAKEMAEFLTKNNIRGYYFELYYNFAREYRVHCTQTGAFLRWRKLRKTDAENRWFFNSSNCVWVGEDNETFDVPVNMKDIDAKCVEAIKSVGLDIGAVDVRVQGKGNTTPSFIILEVNSAPSLGEMGNKVYAGKIEEIIASKIKDETNIV